MEALTRCGGGGGHDTYVIDHAADLVVENTGAGTDTVRTYVDYRIGSNVENMVLIGTAVIGTGNSLDNTILGNEGRNFINGAAGADSMRGGGGHDTYVVDSAGDLVVESSNAGTDTVRTYVGYALAANVENMILIGADAISGTGNNLSNTIIGNHAANVLSGHSGNDSLRGMDGDDVLVGGGGSDVLLGGTGADSFLFDDDDFGRPAAFEYDRILDFSQLQGDRIDLTGVDANSTLAGDQAFIFVGMDAFTNTAGQVRYEQVSGKTYIYGDVDGDSVADFMIQLHGLHTIDVGDFIL